MTKLLEAIRSRSNEPSSWVGAAVLAALSTYFGPAGAEAILTAASAVLAAIAVLMPERGGEK